MATNRDDEYAMQHFDFLPGELADEFSQSTIELLGSVMKAMQSKLLEKQPNLEKEYVEQSIRKLEEIYIEKMEKVFSKVGSYWAAHVFRVPSHVLLPADDAWDGQTQARVNKKLDSAKVMMEEERVMIQNLIYKKEVLGQKLGKVEKAIAAQEQALSEDAEVKHALDLDNLEDTLATISLSSRSLLMRKEDLRKAEEELGIAGVQTQVSNECKLFNRANRQRIDENGARVAAQLGR